MVSVALENGYSLERLRHGKVGPIGKRDRMPTRASVKRTSNPLEGIETDSQALRGRFAGNEDHATVRVGSAAMSAPFAFGPSPIKRSRLEPATGRKFRTSFVRCLRQSAGLHSAKLLLLSLRDYSWLMERGFHIQARLCCTLAASVLAIASHSAVGQEADEDANSRVPQESQSFEDGFSDFDIPPPPHIHPEGAVDITAIEPREESAVGDVVRDLGTGHASYYGRRFHGRQTANGERFDMRAMTAAHKTLPFGSMVRVTNTRNGRSIIVRINDRGPFIKGRVIDLSRGAAERIGLVQTGVGVVRMELLAS